MKVQEAAARHAGSHGARKFLDDHPDEVFRLSELAERMGLHNSDHFTDRLPATYRLRGAVGGGWILYGCPGALKQYARMFEEKTGRKL